MLLLTFAPDGARAQAQGLLLDRSLGAPPSGRGPDLPTFLTADRIEGFGGGEVDAVGDAEIRRGDTTLNADRIQYFTDSDEAEATGNVRLRLGPDEITGPRLRMRVGDSAGIFDSPTFRMGQRTVRSRLKRGQQLGPQPVTTLADNRLRVDLEGHGTASAIRFEGDERYRVSDATFTTCKPGENDWYIEARELDIDMEREVGTARGGSLTFLGVSTPTLPWFDFPLNNERKSGFLPPTIGTQNNVGVEVFQPFYWNIAPNYDATITPRYMEKRGLQWLTQVRFLQPYFRGEARYELLPDDKVLNETRWAGALLSEFNFRNGFTGLINYQKVSDDNYFRDLSGRFTIATQIYLPQQILGAYTSPTGWWNATANYQRFQTLQDTQNPVPIPYYREPQLLVNALRPVGPGIDLGFRGEYVSFGNAALVPTGQRATGYPSVAWPLVTSYGFVKPKVGVAAVGYDLATLGTFTDKRPSVVAPIGSVDSGLNFERDVRWFGSEYLQTLEPRAYYLYVPYRNQTDLPVFDTTNTDLNYSQLFQENIFAGGDRIANANQLSIGATSRLVRPGDGQELVRGVIGQRYYFTEQKVTIPGQPVRTANVSPLILGVAGRIAPNWSAEIGTQYQFVSPSAFAKFSAGARYSPAPSSVASLSYRYINQNYTAGAGTIQNVDAAAQWPLGGGFFGVGRWSYDVVGNKTVETLVGVEYNAGCWIVRAVAQQFQTSTAQQTNAFFIQLEFSGLARIGSNPLEVLRRNVPGYSLINQSTTDPRMPGTGFLDEGPRVVPIRSNTPSAYGTYD